VEEKRHEVRPRSIFEDQRDVGSVRRELGTEGYGKGVMIFLDFGVEF
jgi:hypothetical protein